jgi:hypothetical protein
MFVLLGPTTGAAFGVASAFADRVWGTVLACIPVAAWFVAYAISLRGGLTNPETASLCYALFGIVIGVSLGQVFDRQRTPTGRLARPRRQPPDGHEDKR